MPALFIIVYFLFCFLIPTVRIYKKTGINPITFSNTGNAHDLIGFYMKIIMLMSLFAGLESIHLFGLQFDLLFQHEIIKRVGITLMILAIVWTVVAQVQMEDSWRIGIDERNQTKLRTMKLFKYSRNPVFLGMLIFQFGIFVCHPSHLFLFILVISFILITIQVRLEESFLLKQHGAEYQSYMKSVPRWLLL